MTANTSSTWDSLVASALLGTDRRAFVPPTASDSVGGLLARLDVSDPEKALLGAAAILALHQRAGRLPATTNTLVPKPCAPETSAECSTAAGQHLTLMLNGHYEDLLPEWLATLAAQGQRVPVEHLPTLLDMGASKPDLRAAIVGIIGERGQWLAPQNGNWGYVLNNINDEELWQTGSKTQRVALLSQLRQRDPNKARDLLATTWAQEVAPDRWAFLQTFRLKLSMADEPFLEEALDDRAKDVRASAADLLKQLPKSRLCARMAERVGQLVKWKTGKKASFAVSLSDECDKGMERDGVQGKSTQGAKVIGEKSYWLAQMLNALSLDAWQALCAKASPTVIVTTAASSKDWSALLLDGLREAATREGKTDWVEALLAESKLSSPSSLFAALPPEKKEKYVLKLLANKPSVKHGEPATPFIFASQHPWSKKFGQAILDALYKDLSGDTVKYSYQLAALLEQIARHLTPSLIPSAMTKLPSVLAEKSAMAKEVDKFLGKVKFRLDMLQAIQHS
jgi:Family of unknown function (DUF5691)